MVVVSQAPAALNEVLTEVFTGVLTEVLSDVLCDELSDVLNEADIEAGIEADFELAEISSAFPSLPLPRLANFTHRPGRDSLAYGFRIYLS